MTSQQQPGSGSSSGKPKPPKPPLPGEDPDLIFKTSSQVEGDVDLGQNVNVNVGGNVRIAGKVDVEEITPRAADPEVENRGLNKQAMRAGSFLISAAFVLIIMLLAIYFFVRDFLR